MLEKGEKCPRSAPLTSTQSTFFWARAQLQFPLTSERLRGTRHCACLFRTQVANGPGFVLGQNVLPLTEHLSLLQIAAPEDVSMLVFLPFLPKERSQVTTWINDGLGF